MSIHADDDMDRKRRDDAWGVVIWTAKRCRREAWAEGTITPEAGRLLREAVERAIRA